MSNDEKQDGSAGFKFRKDRFVNTTGEGPVLTFEPVYAPQGDPQGAQIVKVDSDKRATEDDKGRE